MRKNYPIIGWREWLALPELGLEKIKAKVDTGARTSALHAFFVRPYTDQGTEWVRFGMHPKQNRTDLVVECTCKVKDRRIVSDSGGHREERYIIETMVVMGQEKKMIEITLTDRDTMRFRMLLGRTAIHGSYLVDPEASYLLGR